MATTKTKAATKTNEQQIDKALEAAGSNVAEYIATIEGEPPGVLMHNADGIAKQAEAKAKAGGPKNKKFIPTPEQECEWSEYRLETGELYLPSHALFRALVEAGKLFNDPNRPRATMTRVIAASVIHSDEEGFVFMTTDGEPITEYEVDIRRAVVQRAAVQRARPLIPSPWMCQVRFKYDMSLIDTELLTNILVAAGRQVGVLDYRPEKSGPFGKFRVESAEVIEG